MVSHKTFSCEVKEVLSWEKINDVNKCLVEIMKIPVLYKPQHIMINHQMQFRFSNKNVNQMKVLRKYQSFYQCVEIVSSMVLTLDGNSEIGSHG